MDIEKPFNLNPKDREILFQLSLNGRMSLTELARRVTLSKQVVSYRIKQMEEKKIIKRYYSITNVYILGKAHYRVFIKLQNMNADVEQGMLEFLLKHPKVAWVLSLDGDFDLFFVVWADNIVEFEQVYDQVIGTFGQYFQEKYFSIATRIEYLPYRFLLPQETPQMDLDAFVFGDVYHHYEPDGLEKKILTALNHEGRVYTSELAQRFGSSPRGIKNKINGLIENKVIIGFNVKIDHNLLGYTYQKVLLKLNDTSRQELQQLSSYLKQKKSVIYLLKTIGTYDFEFELMTESPEAFYNLIKELRLRFAHNIKDHSMVVMSEEHKYEHLEL